MTGFPAWKVPAVKVREVDVLLSAFNPEVAAKGQVIYILECTHRAVLRFGARRTHCKDCQAIWDAGLDLDGFRKGLIPDPLAPVD